MPKNEDGKKEVRERLQKVIAAAGVTSRRAAEQLILDGRVKVNGTVVKELGTRVDFKARVAVDNKLLKKDDRVYYLFNKPRGVVTTMSDPEGRRSIKDFTQEIANRVFPVGRLDYNTEGLLLLTNDGTLAQRLMHPSGEVHKVYQVAVPGKVPEEKLDLLRAGILLEDGMTAPAFVTGAVYEPEKNISEFQITIHEGRNRQVRRMCDYIGFPVRKLARVELAGIRAEGLKRGKYRELTEGERRRLFQATGLNG